MLAAHTKREQGKNRRLRVSRTTLQYYSMIMQLEGFCSAEKRKQNFDKGKSVRDMC